MHTRTQSDHVVNESRGLLNNHAQDEGSSGYGIQAATPAISPYVARGFAPELVLPIPFLAAVGVAATAATTVFAYAVLLCKDPTRCESDERAAYSTTVVTASLIGNVAALLMLGPMEKLVAKDKRSGLLVWLVFRSMSIIVLALGVSIHSIIVAVSGRIFQGLASDNMLHFTLNTGYVQASDAQRSERLIGVSLGLYMIGISISPAVASLLPNFTASFAMALAVFAIAFIYLLLCVRSAKQGDNAPAVSVAVKADRSKDRAFAEKLRKILRILSSPLRLFVTRPILSFPGMSLFLYTAAQSYLFPAIMVDTSLRFGFDGAQNGYVVSIAHAVSSLYLSSTLFVIPKLASYFSVPGRIQSTSRNTQYAKKGNSCLALILLTMQGVALALFGSTSQSWQVYPIIVLVSLGLAAPFHIKMYFLALTPQANIQQAVAASSMMEALGSLLSPMLLGGWQVSWPGTAVFFLGAFIMSFCVVLFLLGIAFDVLKRKSIPSSDDDAEGET